MWKQVNVDLFPARDECNNILIRIVKESGCNEMTCPCGQKMCYVCKQPIDSAREHFQTLREENRLVLFLYLCGARAKCALQSNILIPSDWY